jgi:hypothetical protein
MMQDEAEKENVDSMVYSNSFLQLMRGIVKELRFPCPKTDQELVEMGIDRASMPATSTATSNKTNRTRFENSGRGDTFVPPWQQAQSGHYPSGINRIGGQSGLNMGGSGRSLVSSNHLQCMIIFNFIV